MIQATENAPQINEWQSRTLADLIRYIVARHHTFLREELPALEALLAQPGKTELQADGLAALARIFHQFRREIEEHLKKEEAILFPMIEKLESARDSGHDAPRLPFGSIRHPIGVMEEEHERARKQLAEIRNSTSVYTKLPGGVREQSSILERFKALDADLAIHSRLEDEVLFPRAIGLERV